MGGSTEGGAICENVPLECEFSASACTEPQPVPQGQPVPSYPVAQVDQPLLVDPPADCPLSWQIALSDPIGNGLDDENHPALGATVYYPTQGGGDLVADPNGLPLLVFSHGNGQGAQNYAGLVSTVVGRGVVMMSIAGGKANVGDHCGPTESCVSLRLCSTRASTGSERGRCRANSCSVVTA